VRSRRAELGVRLALGASPDRLQVHVAAAVIPVALLGIAAGLASGVLGARTAGALLYGVSPFDPVALTGAVSVMVGAVVLAIWLPARRVGRIDAVEAIRTE
jgi:ABC-type antimicrobial peptide transport system permease subunit